MKYQVLIENSTGDVIAAGYMDLTKDSKYNGATHSIRNDAPDGILTKGINSYSIKEYHRWVDPNYELVNNSTAFNLSKFNRKRDSLLRQTKWLSFRQQQQITLNITTSITSQKYTDWLNYWKDLRDLHNTQNFDSENPIWPSQPT